MPKVKSSQSHASYNNSRKLEILETQRRKQWSNRKAAKHFGVAEGSIRKWKRVEEQLAAAPTSRKRLSGGGQKVKNPELDRTLIEWIDVQRSEGVPVNGAMIKDEARRISGGDDSFKASNGWLGCLKKRHGLMSTKRGKTGTLVCVVQQEPKDKSVEEASEVKSSQLHTSFENSTKLEILETQRRRQWSNRKAAKHFGVAEGSIRKWKRVEEQLAAAPTSRKRLSGGGQKVKNPELDRTLIEWIDVQQREGVPVNGAMIKDEARRISGGDDSFKASNGWLGGLKKRHGLMSTKRGKTGSLFRVVPQGIEDSGHDSNEPIVWSVASCGVMVRATENVMGSST
ncbi:uncharacterized protein [Branchiostoma lanceolatum]|uniref:uncharacterized protein n=1 Tax=Branchiostoma lanceolatum TaxID=7740 RepID=UPI003454D27C